MNLTLAAMKKRLLIFAEIFAAGLISTELFILIQKPEAAAVCGVCTLASLVPLYRQGRRIYWSKVICESTLLTVPSAVVTGPGCERAATETVVSVFGLLLGEQPYTWGCGKGVRLRELAIDGRKIRLKFGGCDAHRQVEFLHGMTNTEQIAEFAERIRYETGVHAEINF